MSRREAVEARARAEAALERQVALERELERRLADTRARRGLLGAVLELVLGGPRARDAAVVARAALGRTAAAPETGELAAARRRVALLSWRLRVRFAPRAIRRRLAPAPGSAAAWLRVARRAAGPPVSGGPRVAWLVDGSRADLALARLAARRSGARVTVARTPGRAPRDRPVLVSRGVVAGAPGWLGRLAAALAADTGLAAAGPRGLTFPLDGPAPHAAGRCTALDAPCALFRPGALAEVPGGDVADLTLGLWQEGRRLAATGEALDAARPARPAAVLDRWGPALRRARDDRPHLCLRVAGRSIAAAERTGDLHLARALAAALERRGVVVEVEAAGDPTPAGACCDVLVHFRGRAPAVRRSGQPLVVWLISHPEDVPDAELERADRVLVASRLHAAALGARCRVPVDALLQFTDAERFRPDPDPRLAADVVFAGNWRSRMRPIVWDALQTTHPPALYGDGWARIAPEHAVASWIDNAELPRLYSSAAIVLNDHWPDMRAAGFISNRVFDALACGAFVVSDPVEGLREELGDAVETDIGDLQRTFDRWLADPAERRRRAAAGREIVLRHHTADVRAGELLELLAATMPGFPRVAAEAVP